MVAGMSLDTILSKMVGWSAVGGLDHQEYIFDPECVGKCSYWISGDYWTMKFVACMSKRTRNALLTTTGSSNQSNKVHLWRLLLLNDNEHLDPT